MPGTTLLITNIGSIAVPVFDGSDNGTFSVPCEPVQIIPDTWLKIKNGKITDIGAPHEPQPKIPENCDVFDASGLLLTPGFIDAHTHPAFFGTRQGEFVRRNRGESYQEIAATGGGILSSIKGVRAASLDELTDLVTKRFEKFLTFGVTTLEAKSGYGLSYADELKSLRAIKSAADCTAIDVSPTLLAAHVVPPEYKANPDDYVSLVCDKILPDAKSEKLVEGIDVFLEKGAFNLEQSKRIFQAGKDAGLMLRIHADQFTSSGGAELAAEFRAATADHMDQTSGDGYKRMAEADVTVVLLPGAVFFLGLDDYAPGRKIIDAGCNIALSTDFNPGSTPTQSLPLMMTLGCIKMGLSPEEALWGVTLGAARALRREKTTGCIKAGYNADLCLWNAEDIAYLPYAYGNMVPEYVFKNGELIAERSRLVR